MKVGDRVIIVGETVRFYYRGRKGVVEDISEDRESPYTHGVMLRSGELVYFTASEISPYEAPAATPLKVGDKVLEALTGRLYTNTESDLTWDYATLSPGWTHEDGTPIAPIESPGARVFREFDEELRALKTESPAARLGREVHARVSEWTKATDWDAYTGARRAPKYEAHVAQTLAMLKDGAK